MSFLPIRLALGTWTQYQSFLYPKYYKNAQTREKLKRHPLKPWNNSQAQTPDFQKTNIWFSSMFVFKHS